ncbi:hypothetical protein L917_21346 [Phytophthora nicotianae]|uniref:Uncharacterized protein n=3 Tax=Phytophthora nicotianae TaxID=4792 RepID=V9DUW8_PHYNI|nr:hypothetical protein F443_22233 [Phytophthora nicotianae P1569]ETL77729.1 hypothetical protein L917_21346 [Phytophthora nicotianae]ETM30993.1 hypothetical protein L914_21351 [Phytophthora nicotianae]ETO59428.1 hypothetical protein F444_22226 [Phytophthora nicotianae P1976]
MMESSRPTKKRKIQVLFDDDDAYAPHLDGLHMPHSRESSPLHLA